VKDCVQKPENSNANRQPSSGTNSDATTELMGHVARGFWVVTLYSPAYVTRYTFSSPWKSQISYNKARSVGHRMCFLPFHSHGIKLTDERQKPYRTTRGIKVQILQHVLYCFCYCGRNIYVDVIFICTWTSRKLNICVMKGEMCITNRKTRNMYKILLSKPQEKSLGIHSPKLGNNIEVDMCR
jgi:hypothetical protein